VQQARTRSIAAYLACRDNIQTVSAQNRLYRLLRNPRILDARLTQRMLALLGQGRTLLVAVALLLWTFAGIAKAKRCRWAQHRSRKKGPRVSLVEVGKHFLQDFLGLLTVEWIQDLWMPPKVRRYTDLKPMEDPQ
jgi:hypothetical protein